MLSLPETRRLLPRLIGGTVAGLVLLPAVWLGFRHGAPFVRAARSLESERAAARREGLALTYDEWRAANPAPAAAKNAAPLYRPLLAHFGDAAENKNRVLAKALPRRSREGASGLPTASERAKARARLAELAVPLATAERASRLPACDWGRRWDDIEAKPSGELAMMRGLVRAFCVRARFRAGDGDLSGAAADLEAAARVSRHAGSEPTLMALLVQTACRAIVNRHATELALEHAADPAAVPLLRRADVALGPAPDLRRALAGEAVFFRSSVDGMRRGKPMKPDGGEGVPAAVKPAHGLFLDAWEANGLAQWRDVLRTMDAAPGDPLGKYRAMQSVEAEWEARYERPGEKPAHLLSAILMPIFGKTASKTLLHTATDDRMRRALIDLLPERQVAGRWPARITAPTDPYNGEPMAYRATPDGRGFTLYSVGGDFQDDGGVPRTAKDEGDIVLAWPPPGR